MATRSTISMKVDDKAGLKNIRTIYCHYDGYLSHNGTILLEHYNTADKVEKLLDLGDLSILEKNLSTDKPHNFSNPVEGVCVAYGRDRGEKETQSRYAFSYHYMNKESYNYIFKDGKWFYFRGNNFKNIYQLTAESISLD